MSKPTHKSTILFPESEGASIDVFRQDGKVVIVTMTKDQGIRTTLSLAATNQLLAAILNARGIP